MKNKNELETIFQEFFNENAIVTDSNEVHEILTSADEVMDLNVLESPEKIKETLEKFQTIPVPLKPWFLCVVAKRLTELKNCSVEDLYQDLFKK